MVVLASGSTGGDGYGNGGGVERRRWRNAAGKWRRRVNSGSTGGDGNGKRSARGDRMAAAMAMAAAMVAACE
jgi:hypothetical protein